MSKSFRFCSFFLSFLLPFQKPNKLSLRMEDSRQPPDDRSAKRVRIDVEELEEVEEEVPAEDHFEEELEEVEEEIEVLEFQDPLQQQQQQQQLVSNFDVSSSEGDVDDFEQYDGELDVENVSFFFSVRYAVQTLLNSSTPSQGEAGEMEPMETLDPSVLVFEPYSEEERKLLVKDLKDKGKQLVARVFLLLFSSFSC